MVNLICDNQSTNEEASMNKFTILEFVRAIFDDEETAHPSTLPSVAGQAGVTTVYFVMSTWNPYAVMLMKTDLQLESAP